jgi:C4-dicarboxylate transporter DctQ subunit
MEIMRVTEAIFDRILDAMCFIAGVLMMFAMLSIGVAIASRYFLGIPMGWVVEISSYILLYITFLVAAWVLKEGGHITIDVVIVLFSEKSRYVIDCITCTLSAVVFFILTWYGAKVTWNLFQMNYFTETTLELPKCIFTAIIFIGSFVLSVQFLRNAHRSLAKFRLLKYGAQDRSLRRDV